MEQFKNVYFFDPFGKDTERIRKDLVEVFKNMGISTVDSSAEADLIASIGGDGTFLQAVRKTGFRNDCVYIGIAIEEDDYMYVDFSYKESRMIEEALTSEETHVRNYPTIAVKINDNQESYCLNEFTLRSSIVKTIMMDVYIDDFLFEQFHGDGILVCTPTGSTGYNKSLGGAVVDPLLKAIQVTELASVNNNKYRTLGTSFLLNKDRPLTLMIDKKRDYYPIMSLDNEALSLQNTEEVQIRVSDRVIKTLKLPNNTFWHKTQRNFL
ncbi:NAD kinase [Salinicoccus halitifaciens]|uniref:NAD kinase n=1 Tax=Salinicoccus halitifaciens TaxID=1073415 RepID=A0ABV2E5N1_9STAP|nr:NAD kinase [Salinicoccus halitifaciens]MCD2137202.1 NAD kinase [Salinicoccus halitifaciens]